MQCHNFVFSRKRCCSFVTKLFDADDNYV